MKKQMLLILFLYALPTICMFPNAKRKLYFDESDESTQEDEKKTTLLDDSVTLWLSFNQDRSLTNEESGKGLPKPDFSCFDTNPFLQNSHNIKQNKKNNTKKRKNTVNPPNSPICSKKNNNGESNDESNEDDLILSAAFNINTKLEKSPTSSNKKIKFENNTNNDCINKSPEKK